MQDTSLFCRPDSFPAAAPASPNPQHEDHRPPLRLFAEGRLSFEDVEQVVLLMWASVMDGGRRQSWLGSGAPDPSSTEARPRTAGRALFGAGYWGSSGRTLAAWGPLGPDVTSNSTAWPSSSER